MSNLLVPASDGVAVASRLALEHARPPLTSYDSDSDCFFLALAPFSESSALLQTVTLSWPSRGGRQYSITRAESVPGLQVMVCAGSHGSEERHPALSGPERS
eukprot:165326-Rhodomonas_salina.1